MKLIVAPDYAGICEKAANIFADEIRRNPACVLGLATGSTPVGLYQQLIRRYQDGTLDLSHVQTFNLDEYCGLAGDHPQSYRWFMQKNLFPNVVSFLVKLCRISTFGFVNRGVQTFFG